MARREMRWVTHDGKVFETEAAARFHERVLTATANLTEAHFVKRRPDNDIAFALFISRLAEWIASNYDEKPNAAPAQAQA